MVVMMVIHQTEPQKFEDWNIDGDGGGDGDGDSGGGGDILS